MYLVNLVISSNFITPKTQYERGMGAGEGI